MAAPPGQFIALQAINAFKETISVYVNSFSHPEALMGIYLVCPVDKNVEYIPKCTARLQEYHKQPVGN